MFNRLVYLIHVSPFTELSFCLELSRKGQSTSGLRRHFRLVHKLKEFQEKVIKTTKKDSMFDNLSGDEKRKLHSLALNAIIEDGRSFNDLNKPGIKKLFDGLLQGIRFPFFLLMIISHV